MSTSSSLRSLLLNASYEPMKIVTWQKALILWFQDKVEVLEYHASYARTVTDQFQLPSVLRLKNYIRPRVNAVRFCRENVYIRDNHSCQYCGHRFPLRELTLDHVLPASQKGEKSWTNVVTACRTCNQRKANRTPEKANMPLLTIPKAPTWLPVVETDIRPGYIPRAWLQYLRLKSA